MIHSSYSDTSLQPLIDFSKKVYGKNAYQASKDFLKWALSKKYLEISTTDTQSGEVYSMIYSMQIDAGFVHFKSFFNYITNEENRGAGIHHLASIRREHNFFIPAVSDPDLSKSYARFGANQIRFNWFKRLLVPLPNLPLIFKFITNKDISIVDKRNDIFISNKLCSTRLSKISEVSKIADIEFIKWRLTSKNNNRVFVLEDNHESALIIAVLGKRHHVPLVRVIYCFGSSSALKKLVDRACQLGRELGAIVCLTTVHEKHSSNFFKDRRYKLRDGINTFYKQVNVENKKSLSNPECLMLCGDLGIEEQFGGGHG
ncbi:hypothetical protein N8260_05525 [Amylibacter sp.]|nr:hypothetical protein [Amylibacter sp.]